MDHSDHNPGIEASIRVVIVDDDLLVRRIVRDLLSQHRDLTVVGVFGDAHDALAAVIANPPDAMVVDISMPGMGGVELTRQVKERHPGVHVLAYTSLADQQSISGMLNAGAAGIVYKESSAATVADAIRAACSGLSVFSPQLGRRLARPQVRVSLSSTETEILRLVSRGLTNDEIGALVHLSPSTVKYHIAHLTEKLGASNRVALAVTAVHLGLADG